jgi:hypothetical protein
MGWRLTTRAASWSAALADGQAGECSQLRRVASRHMVVLLVSGVFFVLRDSLIVGVLFR